MQRIRYYYLLKLQYLGFRYHGWQKQQDVKTVERMLERTLAFVLNRHNFKLLAAGRTDAMVSVNQTFVELFIDESPLDPNGFLPLLNQNLPQDIRALAISETDRTFNIIKHAKAKEYLYLFSFGEKFHPFSASLMVTIHGELDIELMKKGTRLFEGEHDFWSYAFRPKPQTQTRGKIDTCEIVENTLFTASFFPEKSYMLRVKGAGFKRNQIRLMMGVLIDLGKREVDLAFIKNSLKAENRIALTHIAPASGLILNAVEFRDKENGA